MYNSQLEEIFFDIITGNGVKRTVHNLVFQNIDYSDLFINCLNKKAFNPFPLKTTKLLTGIRIPGFYLEKKTAIFGYLFWEVFSERKKRKIWGSVIRNQKGDWKYILSGHSSKVVYLNMSKIQEVDIFHLT